MCAPTSRLSGVIISLNFPFSFQSIEVTFENFKLNSTCGLNFIPTLCGEMFFRFFSFSALVYYVETFVNVRGSSRAKSASLSTACTI